MSARPAPRLAQPPAPRPRRRRPIWIWIAAGGLTVAAALAIGIFSGVILAKRAETGRWELPDMDTVVETIKPDRPPPVSKIIYLVKEPATFTPGTDDAVNGVSAVVKAHHPQGPVNLPGWRGSKKNWTKLVACVQKLFAPFDVVVTDEEPASVEHIRVAVGGKAKDIGLDDKHVSGLAPFNGEVIPRAVVFAFAAQVNHDVRTICETIGMEVAHAYGLDHEYLCKDLMTYLPDCGARSFVDKDAPCGEKKKRPCHGGAPTQNSYQLLLRALGPRDADDQ